MFIIIQISEDVSNIYKNAAERMRLKSEINLNYDQIALKSNDFLIYERSILIFKESLY